MANARNQTLFCVSLFFVALSSLCRIELLTLVISFFAFQAKRPQLELPKTWRCLVSRAFSDVDQRSEMNYSSAYKRNYILRNIANPRDKVKKRKA